MVELTVLPTAQLFSYVSGGYTGAHLVAIAVAFMLGMAAAVSYKEHRIGTSENTKIAQVVERVGRLPGVHFICI